MAHYPQLEMSDVVLTPPAPSVDFKIPSTTPVVPNQGDNSTVVVSQQPGSVSPTQFQGGGWAATPNQRLPTGVDYLLGVDQVLIHQKIELLELFTGFETANKYEIKNSMGQGFLYAVEDSDCCTRNCCGNIRPFEMKILNHLKEEVIHLNRPCRCMGCCYPCCLQEMEVMCPPGNLIGTVKQKWSLCFPSFTVEDANGELVATIDGPLCVISCCADVDFPVMSANGSTEIGKISKQWSGFCREAITDADHFGVSFPMDMRVDAKMLLLGACFLIDFMYFERQN